MKHFIAVLAMLYVTVCVVFATAMFYVYIAREKLGYDLFFDDWQIAASTVLTVVLVARGYTKS